MMDVNGKFSLKTRLISVNHIIMYLDFKLIRVTRNFSLVICKESFVGCCYVTLVGKKYVIN